MHKLLLPSCPTFWSTCETQWGKVCWSRSCSYAIHQNSDWNSFGLAVSNNLRLHLLLHLCPIDQHFSPHNNRHRGRFNNRFRRFPWTCCHRFTQCTINNLDTILWLRCQQWERHLHSWCHRLLQPCCLQCLQVIIILCNRSSWLLHNQHFQYSPFGWHGSTATNKNDFTFCSNF